MADEGGLVRTPPRSLATFLPITVWIRRYRTSDLGPDLTAGVALAALLIPESMGYAGVAGVPPEVGLYAALGAVLAYVVTGGTSILVVGPASAVAALSASIVGDVGGADPVVLSAALALMSGLLLVVAGVLRFGWVVNFISGPVLHAFVAGLSISIIIGQLDGLFGVKVDAESALGKLVDVVRHLGEWSVPTAVVGLGSVATILLLERWLPRVPAALVVVAAGVLLVVLLDLQDRGVEIVGEIPRGLPDVGIPDLPITTWLELFAGGAALLLVGFSEGYAAASSVAAERDEEVDADQELYSSGMANIASGALGGLAVSGSLSKSAASSAAGARTQVANLTAGVLVLATLLFLGPVFERLPEPVLAAVVIVAVLRSADPRLLVGMWRVNRLDFAAASATFVLVLVWETLPAMIVGVLLSLAFVVRRASFPDVVELRPEADGTYGRLDDLTGVAPSPGDVAVVRLEAPLIYANAARLKRAVRSLVRSRPPVRVLVLDGEMFSDLDTSGATALEELDGELAAASIELRLARVHTRARDQLERSGIADRFRGRTFPTVHAAAGIEPRTGDDAAGP
ncbi:SulP family inorganic anion transporter [Nocardioides sp. GXQ0305]|uniref:SulP family inorganic anion transporter n=1 Tax=Nocardioides sp. GXQ0305 TaxID=3423912 RepID=UPI003D7D56E2